jgi:hypothetical protein
MLAGTLFLLGATVDAQTIWNLADDFSLASNPNVAWTYQLEVTAPDDDTAYTPLEISTRSANEIWGTAFATSPTMRTQEGGFWGIGRNDTGVIQTSTNVIWNPGEVLFHPDPDFADGGGRFIITWTAPADMTVDVEWEYAKRALDGATGVGMGVLHESGGANVELRAFANPEGASGMFDNLAVLAGDSLHFRFDNWGDAGGDITWAAIVVSEVDPLDPNITSFAADPATLGNPSDAVTFDWNVSGLPLDSLVITPGDIDVLGDTDGAGTGSHVLDPGPDGTTEYTLTATKGGESAVRKVTVTLPAPAIVSFEVTPAGAAPGEAAMFSWEVGIPVTTLMLTPGDIDLLPHTDAGGTGSFTLDLGPDETTTYTLTATRGTSVSTASAIRLIIDPNAIFFDDFGSFTVPNPGNFNGGQFESGLVVAFSGDLNGWNKDGGGVVHAVDQANVFGVDNNPPDFSVMIWQDNVITLANAIPGSNQSGAPYAVSFGAGPGVYQAGNQQTGETDGLLIEILRADDSVLETYTHLPGTWAGAPTLVADSFEYVGDGSGDIRVRIGPSAPGSGHFGGTIDNLAIVPANQVPFKITDVLRDPGTLAATITFDSVDGVIYEVWGSPDLQSWQDLDDSVVGTGNSTQFTDSVFAPANLQYYYQVRRP